MFDSSRRLQFVQNSLDRRSFDWVNEYTVSAIIDSSIFIVGLHRSGSTLWHNLISIGPGVLRLTNPRFLSERRHKDFHYFLRTQAGDLSIEQNVDKMVEICFSKQSVPGLDSTFWQFKDIDLVNDPELKRAISDRIRKSDKSLGHRAGVHRGNHSIWRLHEGLHKISC